MEFVQSSEERASFTERAPELMAAYEAVLPLLSDFFPPDLRIAFRYLNGKALTACIDVPSLDYQTVCARLDHFYEWEQWAWNLPEALRNKVHFVAEWKS